MIHMKYRKILHLSFLLAVFAISGFTSSVSGAAARVVAPVDPLIIDDAYYCDVDGDLLEDDCRTFFTLYSPTGFEASMIVDLYLSIELPSGQKFYFTYEFGATFVNLPFEIQWYNVAIESGDYIFTVIADMHGWDINRTHFKGTVSETLIFDPREYRDGSIPFAMVIY